MDSKLAELRKLKDALQYTYRRNINTEELNKATSRWGRYTWATIDNPAVLNDMLNLIDEITDK